MIECFEGDGWRATVYRDVWDAVHEWGADEGPVIVDALAGDWWADWEMLHVDPRPTLLELRAVVRFALRQMGRPAW